MRLKFLKDFDVPGIGAVKANAIIEVDDTDTDAPQWIKDGVCAVEKAAPAADVDAAIKSALEKATADSKAQIDALTAEVKALKNATARRPIVEVGKPAIEDDPKRGFKSFGEFVGSVLGAGRGGEHDKRLGAKASLSTYANEGSDSDGGFLIPPEFSGRILEIAMKDDFSLMGRCDQNTCSGNSMTFLADETTDWGSAGIQAYWLGEGGTYTQTKPVLKERTLRLKKLGVLVPLTDELMADAAAAGSMIANKAGRKIMYKVNDAIINGTGAGQPLGIMNSVALKTVAKKTGQTAATLVLENILKMYSAMPAVHRGNAAWFMNQDCEPQLFGLSFDEGASAGKVPIYLPPNGLADNPLGRLMGSPVIPIPSCQTLGTVGDFLYLSLDQYILLTKAGGIETAQSMHLWFDQGANALRLTFRVDGQPWLSAPVSAANGSATYSPFVALATRA